MGRGVRISGELFEGCRASLLAEFRKFHRKNPWVFRLFKQLAFQAKEAGRKRYSHQAIWHILRWNFDLPTKGLGDYKLSNNYIALYARLAIKEHPKHFGHGFFRLRPFVSDKRSKVNDQKAKTKSRGKKSDQKARKAHQKSKKG